MMVTLYSFVEYSTKGAPLGMQLWLSLTRATDYATYCTNVDLSFDEVCIWGCSQLQTSLIVTKILDLQGDPHLRWCCEPRSTGLCAIFVGQSTEESATSTFALNEGNSPHSSILTRSEHVCIHISFSSYVLRTTFECRGLVPTQMTALQMPVPCSQYCNSISNKAHTELTKKKSTYRSARIGDFLHLSEQFFFAVSIARRATK
jgi:hypothetical protein